MKKNRFYGFITIVLLSILPCGCNSKTQTEGNSARRETVPIAGTIAKTDELFKPCADVSKLREAADLLAQARNPDNRNYEIERKFAEYNYFPGKQTGNEQESEKAFGYKILRSC